MTTGRIFVMSAPSGTGKTTVIREVLRRLPNVALSVSYTTRVPRAGERDGVDYHFVSSAVFDQMIADDDFLEWVEVHGNRYGTSKSAIAALCAAGRDVLLDIEVQGARAVRDWNPHACLFFLLPPSLEELQARLLGRNSETAESLATRLARAVLEMDQQSWYDHVVINHTIEQAVADVVGILQPAGGARG